MDATGQDGGPATEASAKAAFAVHLAFLVSVPLVVSAGWKLVNGRVENRDYNCLTAAATWAYGQAAVAGVAVAFLLAAAVLLRRPQRADRRSGWPSPGRECFALAVVAWVVWAGLVALDPRADIPQPACGGL